MDTRSKLTAWIEQGRALGASDLHLESGAPLAVRVRSTLHVTGEPIAPGVLAHLARELLGEAWASFLERGSADVSVGAAGLRCRVSLFRTLRGLALAVRLLQPAVNDLRACNLHPDLRRLVEPASGLVVLCGPTGSGKSTTLAALIEEINAARALHVITLESPLEYVFNNRRALIRQREIPTHSPSFEQAITDALRENPDVLVIGEMRTPEAMRLTLNAAETGHLVLATMHSASAAEALTRITMSFPAELQSSVRAQLADCLVGVLCQRLEFLPEQKLRVPRCELLLASTAVRGTLRAGQLSQLGNVMQSGGEEGMWTFERYQRWMDAKSDWVRPASSASAPAEPTRAPAPATLLGSPAPSAPASMPPARPGELTIDEDLDREELAALARRIEERTR